MIEKAAVSPGLKPGRGLKRLQMALHANPAYRLARLKTRAWIETPMCFPRAKNNVGLARLKTRAWIETVHREIAVRRGSRSRPA